MQQIQDTNALYTYTSRRLDWQHHLHTHVLSLMHEFPVDDDLVYAHTVVDCVCGVCCSSDLDLAPLTVGWNQLA